jgi:hypothetical protein
VADPREREEFGFGQPVTDGGGDRLAGLGADERLVESPDHLVYRLQPAQPVVLLAKLPVALPEALFPVDAVHPGLGVGREDVDQFGRRRGELLADGNRREEHAVSPQRDVDAHAGGQFGAAERQRRPRPVADPLAGGERLPEVPARADRRQPPAVDPLGRDRPQRGVLLVEEVDGRRREADQIAGGVGDDPRDRLAGLGAQQLLCRLVDGRETVFVADAVADVPDDAHLAVAPVAERVHREARLDREFVAVGPLERGRDRRRVAVPRDERRAHRRRLLKGLLAREYRGVRADQVRPVIARQFGDGFVDRDDVERVVEDVDTVVDRLDDPFVLFEVAKPLLGVRHVVDHRDVPVALGPRPSPDREVELRADPVGQPAPGRQRVRLVVLAVGGDRRDRQRGTERRQRFAGEIRPLVAEPVRDRGVERADRPLAVEDDDRRRHAVDGCGEPLLIERRRRPSGRGVVHTRSITEWH